MKKKSFIALLLCAVLTFLLVGCSSVENTETDTKVVNPEVTYNSLADAVAAAGFTFTIPEGVNIDGEDYAQYNWKTIDGSLLEVSYGYSGDEVCYIRKASAEEGNAASLEDISGDYSVYEDVQTVDIMMEDGRESTITLKGKDGKYYLAIWQTRMESDNHTWNYAIGIRGVGETELVELAKMVL